MPRYDYRCEAGHKYERVESFGAPAEHPCDRCGRPARRMLVAPPLVFKGGGFYKTSGGSGVSTTGTDAPSSGRSKKKAKASGGDAASNGNGASDSGSSGSSGSSAAPSAPSSAAD